MASRLEAMMSLTNWKGRHREGDGDWKNVGSPLSEGKHHSSLQHPRARSRERSRANLAGGSVGLQHCMAQVVRKPCVSQNNALRRATMRCWNAAPQ